LRWFLQATKNGESRVLQETKNISSQELSRGLLLTIFLVADATSSLSHDDAFISTRVRKKNKKNRFPCSVFVLLESR